MRIRIVGCGVPDAGDDQLGLLAARRLRALLPSQVDVIEDSAGGARVESWCDGVDFLFVLDVAAAGDALRVGAHLRFAYPRDRARLEETAIRGSHSISLEQGLRLAETLGLLPRNVVIHVLTASCFEPGTSPATALLEPFERFITAIRAEVLEPLRGSA